MTNLMPKILPQIHQLESTYGSLSNAPQAEIDKLHQVVYKNHRKRKAPLNTRERGALVTKILASLDTAPMTIDEIVRFVNMNDQFTKNGLVIISEDSMRQMLHRRHLPYKARRKDERSHD